MPVPLASAIKAAIQVSNVLKDCSNWNALLQTCAPQIELKKLCAINLTCAQNKDTSQIGKRTSSQIIWCRTHTCYMCASMFICACACVRLLSISTLTCLSKRTHARAHAHICVCKCVSSQIICSRVQKHSHMPEHTHPCIHTYTISNL